MPIHNKAYDTVDFAASLRCMQATPHVAQKIKGSSIDGRTTRHPGYDISQKARKRVEEIFGWMETIGGIGQVQVRGLRKQSISPLHWLPTISYA